MEVSYPYTDVLTATSTFRIGTGQRVDIMQEQAKTCSSPGPFAYDPLDAIDTLHKTKKTLCYEVTTADAHFHQMIDRFVKRKQRPVRNVRRKIMHTES